MFKGLFIRNSNLNENYILKFKDVRWREKEKRLR